MPYSTDIASILSEQLAKFATLNRHQLSGQVANLEFWLAEVRHCLNVIDGYPRRFEQLKRAQSKHVSEHHTTTFNLDDPRCTQWPPEPPRRVPHTELQQSRRSLCDATYRFLLRCVKERFIDEPALQRECDRLSIGVAITDLKNDLP